MKFTLNKAAKVANVAKSTVLKAITSGRMSAPKNEKGHYEIDPAELFRVFPKKQEAENRTDAEQYLDLLETTRLKAQLELAEQRFSDAEKTIEDLRKRLDDEASERRETQRALTHMTHQEQERTRQGFWARLFGGQ